MRRTETQGRGESQAPETLTAAIRRPGRREVVTTAGIGHARLMRTSRAMLDWEIFLRAAASTRESGLELWSRFPLELGDDLIVAPHLYDWPKISTSGRDGASIYTCSERPEAAVFCGRGPHRTFLKEEVVPRVLEAGVPIVVLVDGDQGLAHFRGIHEGCVDARQLGKPLEAWYGRDGLFEEDAFSLNPDPMRWPFPLEGQAPTPEAIARAEANPLRLWEALFWRGYTYRYEVVGGELPLVADLLTPLAANRTLMQLVADAERWTGTPATEAMGFIVCGPFRLRQQDHRVELRVALSPADVRVSFAPQRRPVGADAEPSLLGALVAGGDNGKTEMIEGYTWSTCFLRDEEEARSAAERLASQAAAWTDAPARVLGPDETKRLEGRRDEWLFEPHDRYLTVWVPVHREGCWPMAVVIGEPS